MKPRDPKKKLQVANRQIVFRCYRYPPPPPENERTRPPQKKDHLKMEMSSSNHCFSGDTVCELCGEYVCFLGADFVDPCVSLFFPKSINLESHKLPKKLARCIICVFSQKVARKMSIERFLFHSWCIWVFPKIMVPPNHQFY